MHESLPSREDTERICKASGHSSVLAHEIMTMPYTTLDQSGLATPETLLAIPGPTAHPVLIARHMLLLATFLQHLHPDLHKEIKGLLESPRTIMERLAELSANLVTTNDELVGSIEGLECVMIESVYQANIGNLRRSWIASRRAMSIAQLMDLNRSGNQAKYKVLDPKTRYHPQLMWFRIVFMDRYLCLMLGLSQGSLDRSMASGPKFANDTPMGRLERIHCVVASRILERNEANRGSEAPAIVKALDTELQKAARALPSKWWLVPDLDMTSTDSQALFWNTRRLFAQIFHYNLLNQLHLPYMLCSSSPRARSEYSRITCVNASREVLLRFITLRSYNGIAYSCRTVDFLALMAAMTLLLAHIDSHNSEGENLLAHQYHSDRAMVEKVQENMEELNHLNSDALSAQGADLLRRLLAIDLETGDESPGCERRVSVHEVGEESAMPDQDDAIVSVHIPYFGIIKITREGMNKEASRTQATNHLAPSHLVHDRCAAATEGPDAESSARASQILLTAPIGSDYRHIEASIILDSSTRTQEQLETLSGPAQRSCDASMQLGPQLQEACSDPLLPHGDFPELAAGADDWALQGVDWAFFENLMRGAGDEETGGVDWSATTDVSANNK